MLRNLLLSATVGVAAMVGGQAAVAADLVKMVPFSLVGPGNATVALPQFDPATGTLNSVTVAESAVDQFALEIFNTGAGGSFTASAQNSFGFGLGGPPSQPGFVNATGAIPAGMPIFTTMPPAVSLGTVTLVFGPTTDAAFIGTGTLDTSVSLSPATVTQFSGSTVSAVLAFAGASGSVTLDYAFTPAVPVAAPEPASIVLLGAGLLGMAMLQRRSRRN